MPTVFLALVFYVGSYSTFVYANCTDEVAFRPNTVGAPVGLSEEGELGLHTPGSVCFDDTYCFTDGPRGRNGDEQVYVVFVGIDSFEDEFRIVVLGFFDTRDDEGLNPFVDDTASVFGRKHNMVVAEEYAV